MPPVLPDVSQGSPRFDPPAADERVASEQLERATAGDRVALDALLACHLPQLHAFVHARLGRGLRPRESSLDIAQSVCRQILAQPQTCKFDGEERFRAWLFALALNKIREKHRYHQAACRARNRETATFDETVPHPLADLVTPSQLAVGSETGAAMAAALAALDDEHRQVITLARIGRLPHRVIAELMGRSEDASRRLLGRALLRLVAELRRRGVEVGHAE